MGNKTEKLKKKAKGIPVLATNAVWTAFSNKFDKYFDKLEKIKLNYRPAFVYRKQDFWSIIFYWRAGPDKPFKRYRKTFGLNRIEDRKIKKKAAAAMAEAITEALYNGWNPDTGEITEVKRIKTEARTSEANKNENILTALHKANVSLLNRSTKDRTHSSKNSLLRLFQEYLKEHKIHKIAISEFNVQMAFDYADWLFGKKYAAKTINTKLDFAGGLFAYLHDKEIIEKNPFQNVRRAKEIKQDTDENLFTINELKLIKTHLQATFPELFQYFLFIFYCLMRPDSIMNIKLEDIDLKQCRLHIWPENHKNQKGTYKQLLRPHLKYLAPYLSKIKERCAPSDYLFSRKMKPGSKKYPPTRAAEFWRQSVKEHLGIEKNAYSGKHTFGTEYVDANKGSEDLKWLQNQMSHGDLQTTSIYVARRRKVKLDESQANIIEI